MPFNHDDQKLACANLEQNILSRYIMARKTARFHRQT